MLLKISEMKLHKEGFPKYISHLVNESHVQFEILMEALGPNVKTAFSLSTKERNAKFYVDIVQQILTRI